MGLRYIRIYTIAWLPSTINNAAIENREVSTTVGCSSPAIAHLDLGRCQSTGGDTL
jgi:hypothetical protein